MKSIFIVILTAAAIVLGGLYVRHARFEAIHAEQQRVLKQELAAKAKALEQAEAERKRAEESRKQLLALSDQLSAELKAKGTSGTNAVGSGTAGAGDPSKPGDQGGFGKLLAGMMEDPAIKKMIRDQQRGMVDSMYDPLIAKMSLTAEQAGQFKNLIADSMVKAAERAGALFGGSASNRTEAVQQMAADQKTLNDQIRGFLGEDRYAQYRDYQDTVQERTQLNMFQQQLGSSQMSEDQTEKLLTLMKEEKQAAMASSGFTGDGSSQEEAGLRAMTSVEEGKKLLDAQEQANRRVYERAAEVLSPEQLASFGTYQTNQMNMMRMGMDMARRFMAPDEEKK